MLKIEVPANRYDLIAFEGIANALCLYLGKEKAPKYKLVPPTTSLTVKSCPVRPFAAAAILRNVKFDERSYASFIDAQDKLHQNIAHRRLFVAIGTHDLDTLQGPFTYGGEAPEDIQFIPLNKTEKVDGHGMMTLFESDKHIGKFLPLIKSSQLYPVMRDARGVVMSVPPIINSEHSKMSVNTKNVFIDLTATDATKLEIVTNILCALFSKYTTEPFTIEQVKIITDEGSTVTPSMKSRTMTARPSFINSCTGLSLSDSEIIVQLNKMGLDANVQSKDELAVVIPPTRTDILHECDIMEDVAIAYGFDNLTSSFPNTNTVANPFKLNKISDTIRRECAMSGYTEVLPLILCSHDENYKMLNRKDNGSAAVLANPQTIEFQIVRTSLLPGLFKTLRENKSLVLPHRIFEVSDIVVADSTLERQCRNERHMAAALCSKKSDFQEVHGLLDKIMQTLDIPYIGSTSSAAPKGYFIQEETNDGVFMPGRGAQVILRSNGRDEHIGVVGIAHPIVLKQYELAHPCSILEVRLPEA